MTINDFVAAAFHGASAKLNSLTARLRRNAILYALAALCAVAAIVLAVAASVLALEPHVGPIYALLIPAGVFAAIVGAIVLTIWLSGRPARTIAAQAVPLHAQSAQRSAQFAQLAMIVEAVLLGYSMARRR